jgi:hypothetical protein
MELIDRMCKILKKKSKVQSGVKVGMWKCSGTTSRNVRTSEQIMISETTGGFGLIQLFG